MADTTTKKLLVEIEAKYADVNRAITRMADLSVKIKAQKDLLKAQGQVTKENAATVADFTVKIKALQKEYNQLSKLAVSSAASAKAFETAMGGNSTQLLSVEAQLTKATLAWKGLDEQERASAAGQEIFQRIQKLTQYLYDNGTQLDKNKLTVGNYAGAIEGVIAKMSKEGQVVGATSQAYAELLTKYQTAEAEARQLTLTKGADDAATKAAITTFKQYGAELDALSAALNGEKVVVEKVISQYDQLTNKYRDASNAAKEAYIVNGEQSVQFKTAKAEAEGYKLQIDGIAKALAAEKQEVVQQLPAYQQLLQKYAQAEAAARELTLTKGKDSAESMEAIASMKAYGKQLDELNTHLGKYQSKTVNASYATFSLSQVVRELPNFAIDTRLGFMALSNNIPMLVQDFQMLTKELGGSGKALKAFGASLLGWNTIAVLASTLLVAYGKDILEWGKKIFGAKEQAKQYASAIHEVNRAASEGQRQAQAEISRIELLYGATQNANRAMSDRVAAVKELQSTYPAYFGNLTQEQILTGKADSAYQNLTESLLRLAVARKLSDKFAENKVKILALEEQNLESERQLVAKNADLVKKRAVENAYRKKLEDQAADVGAIQSFRLGKLTKESNDVQSRIDGFTKSIDENNQAIERLRKENELLKSSIDTTDLIKATSKPTQGETEAQKNKRLSDEAIAHIKEQQEAKEKLIQDEEGYLSEDFATKQSYAKRLFDLDQETKRLTFEALVKYHQKTKAEQAAYNAKLENETKAFDTKQANAAKKETERLGKEALAEYKKLNKLLKNEKTSSLDEELQATSDAYDEQLKAFVEAQAKRTDLTSADMYAMYFLELEVEEKKQQALANIRAKYAKQDEERSRAAIIKQFADETLAAKQGVEERYAANKKRIDDELDLLSKKYGESQQMSEQDASRYKKLLEDRLANDKMYEENKLQVKQWFSDKATELLNAFSDVMKGLSEREVQDAQDSHDEQAKALDDRLSQGLMSTKDHDKAIKKLDEDLDKEKAKIARRQAIRERVMSSFQIAINTAKAIMGIWADFPKIDFGVSASLASAMVAATGAAQVAAVWAAPLPKASKGMLLEGPSHSFGGIKLEAEGGEAVINKRSTSMFKPLLSAINQAGGGVKFASGGFVGLSNDGGLAARQAINTFTGATAEQLAEAMQGVEIIVTVEDIDKAQKKAAKVKSRGSY